jgi:hypothetical protein
MMQVRRDIVMETLTTLEAAADRLELLEFKGHSAGIVSACRLLGRTLTMACTQAEPSRIEPAREKPILVTREALQTVLREQVQAVMVPAVREIVAVITELLAEQATDGPPVESPSPVAQGANGNGRA